MRRDWEEVIIYDSGKTVKQVFFWYLPVKNINPETGHEIAVKIIRREEVLCEDYGKIFADDYRFDDMPVKKIVCRPDEIQIYV